MTKIGFVGTGQMAQALAGGISASDETLSFVVSDPATAAIEAFESCVSGASVERAQSNADVFTIAEVVFLALKPQFFDAAIKAIAIEQAISNREQLPLVVSVMAGVSIDQIQKKTSINEVIRVMPNTPCLVGAGACGMACSAGVSEDRKQQVQTFLETTGIVVSVSERLLDAVTGLSGSGPAYVFELIDALALGGVKSGLSRTVANQLAAQTVFGAAKLAIDSGEHPSVLRDRVTSPGGTTIAGLKALLDGGFPQSVMSAVEAAADRSEELGKDRQ